MKIFDIVHKDTNRVIEIPDDQLHVITPSGDIFLLFKDNERGLQIAHGYSKEHYVIRMTMEL